MSKANELATLFQLSLAELSKDQIWTGAQRSGDGTVLISNTSIVPILGNWQGNRAFLTLAHNVVIENPSDLDAMVGYVGRIVGQQDATGNRTLGVGSFWFPIGSATMPTAPTAANAKFRIDFEVVSATRIDFTLSSVGA